MSFTGTYYMRPETLIHVSRGTVTHEGPAVISLASEGLTIQANCWEDMQRLVIALHDGIARARQIEEAAAVATELV